MVLRAQSGVATSTSDEVRPTGHTEFSSRDCWDGVDEQEGDASQGLAAEGFSSPSCVLGPMGGQSAPSRQGLATEGF